MSLQLIIVLLAVLLSVAYVIYRAWKAFHEASDPCRGCPGCALKDKKPPCMTLHNDSAKPCKEKK